VPAELRVRLRDVFRKRSSDARILGQVTRRGRRDIELATRLPVRVSLRSYLHGGQSAAEFGAPERGQWPPWAVRRFLLYDVLLHELGHLQKVERKFASERKAQELADELRRTLYSEPSGLDDPIHDAPTEAEVATLSLWERLDKPQRALLVEQLLRLRALDFTIFEPMTSEQRDFLVRVLTSRA
jgi:hypothetical protein